MNKFLKWGGIIFLMINGIIFFLIGLAFVLSINKIPYWQGFLSAFLALGIAVSSFKIANVILDKEIK